MLPLWSLLFHQRQIRSTKGPFLIGHVARIGCFSTAGFVDLFCHPQRDAEWHLQSTDISSTQSAEHALGCRFYFRRPEYWLVVVIEYIAIQFAVDEITVLIDSPVRGALIGRLSPFVSDEKALARYNDDPA